jgi:hypothetical protein
MADAVPVGVKVSSADNIRVGETKSRYPSDLFERFTRFVKEVGFPIAVATACFAYMWFVGVKSNEHMARGQALFERALTVLERLERKIP